MKLHLHIEKGWFLCFSLVPTKIHMFLVFIIRFYTRVYILLHIFMHAFQPTSHTQTPLKTGHVLQIMTLSSLFVKVW